MKKERVVRLVKAEISRKEAMARLMGDKSALLSCEHREVADALRIVLEVYKCG